MFAKVKRVVSDVFFGFRLADRPQYHINKPFPSRQTYVLKIIAYS